MMFSNNQANQTDQITHQPLSIHQTKPNKFTFGAIKINYLMYMFIPLMIGSPIYTYYMAVSKNQEKPFPHATITNTACYYPQAIVFRFTMLIASSFLTVLYYGVFRWVDYLKNKIGYPYQTYGWMYYLAQSSILGFMAAIGTIDAAGYPNLHDIGAIFFFIVLFFMTVIITLVLRDMRKWDTSAISRQSYIIKSLLTLYLIIVAVYCLVGLATEGDNLRDDDKYVVILEWNLVFACLVWILSFRRDWEQVYLMLEKK